jgi:hypothetical protein
LLLVIGTVAAGLSYFLNGEACTAIGPFAHTLTWLFALALSFTVFGLAPAEIISREVQAGVLAVFLGSMPCLLLAWMVWRWLHRYPLRFSLCTMLTTTFVLCLLFGFVAYCRPDAESLESLLAERSIPTRGWEGMDADSLANLFAADKTWFWALLQWIAYRGPYLTLVLWAGAVVFAHRRKRKRVQRRAPEVDVEPRTRWYGVFRSLGWGAFAAATCALLVYLTAAPIVVRSIEREFQRKIAFARDPQSRWTKVEEAIRKVQSNVQLMRQLNEEVEVETQNGDDVSPGDG